MTRDWVLLRGLTREAGHWGALPRALQDALPDVRLHLLDLPGAGVHHGLRCPRSVAAITAHCRAELARRGVAGPVGLLGLSMGGMVAADWAQRHPAEVAALVMVNSSTRSLSPLHRRLRPAAWRAVPALLWHWGHAPAEARVLALSSRHHADDPAVVGEWVALQRSRPVGRANALRQLLAAARHRVGPRPSCPTWVVCSARDALVHPDCSRALARHWGVVLAEHPEAGHDLALDDPAWLARRLAAWVTDGASPQKR